jgi:hypothetical protein
MTYASRFFTTLLLLGPLAGCVQAYKPPTAGEPHAVLKIRRTYESKAGATLTERVMIDEYLALEQQVPVRAVPESDTGAVLLHPAAARITVKALFTHEELKHVQETYTEQESPRTSRGSTTCGCQSRRCVARRVSAKKAANPSSAPRPMVRLWGQRIGSAGTENRTAKSAAK